MADREWHYILDANGNPQPVDFLTFAEWFETADRNICQDMDEGEGALKVRVSTVFLGLDLSFSSSRPDPPLLFETRIFGGPLDGEMMRYATRDAAVLGHQVMCAKVKAAMQQDR